MWVNSRCAIAARLECFQEKPRTVSEWTGLPGEESVKRFDVFSGGTMRQLSTGVSLVSMPSVLLLSILCVQPVFCDVFSGGTVRQLSMGVSFMSMPSVLLLSMYMDNLHVVMSSVEALCSSWAWESPSCPCRPYFYCLCIWTTCMWRCLQWSHYAPVEHGCLPHVHAVRTSTVYVMYMYNLYVVMSSVVALCVSWAWESPSCPCRPYFYCLCIWTTCMWWCLQWRHYAPVEHGNIPHVHAVRTSTVYVYGQPACGDVFSGGTMLQLSMGVSLMSMPSVLLLSILYVQPACVDVFSGGTMRQLSMGVSLMSMPSVLLLSILYVQPACVDVFSCGTMRQLSMGVSLMSMPSVLLLSMYMYNLYVLMSSVEALCASWAWVSPSCPCRP